MKLILSSLIFISILSFAQSTDDSVKKSAAPAKKVLKKRTRTPMSPQKAAIFRDMAAAQKNKDPLALRVSVKRLANQKLSPAEWVKARRIIVKNPEAGFDLLYKWDSVVPSNYKVPKEEAIVNKRIAMADQYMNEASYDKAFNQYQQVAKYLKKLIEKGKKENTYLYYTTVQFMGRALFSAGRFSEALTVYNWIPASYQKYRQVLFEKMWTGFRMGRSDITNGAIGSQNSSYFANIMEPEAYLVQIYVYKKLCREEDVKLVLKLLNQFKERLDNGTLDYKEWAKSEIETYMLLRLAEQDLSKEAYTSVSPVALKAEQEKINKLLASRFESEKTRYLSQIRKVEGYSLLALGSGKLQFKKEKVLSRSDLMKGGKEVWPVDEGEDWVDEIGQHLYIGESQCEK